LGHVGWEEEKRREKKRKQEKTRQEQTEGRGFFLGRRLGKIAGIGGCG
jgi:hypothetical protein